VTIARVRKAWERANAADVYNQTWGLLGQRFWLLDRWLEDFRHWSAGACREVAASLALDGIDINTLTRVEAETP